ncbi:hypothetical protein MMC25_001119 [Agyrium rufum]|nr:hypothetical protein [Agyrium rufum]
MTTTPPLQSLVRDPPTPFQGAKYDNFRGTYQPYSRRQTRSSTQRAARTPSPGQASAIRVKQTTSNLPKFTITRSVARTLSPPSSAATSPETAPVKKLMHAQMPKPRSAELDHKKATTNSEEPTGMLPTPVKTPHKPKVVQPRIQSTARILFPNHPHPADDPMPSPLRNARRNRRNGGYTLRGFGDDIDIAVEEQIEIYTDIKDRLPEVDDSADNPFYEQSGGEVKPVTRQSKRRKIATDNSDVSEAFQRGDGMVYVFRGKKLFRKFEDEGLSDDNADDALPQIPTTLTHEQLLEDVPQHLRRPFTRSSVKPRLLFPTEAQLKARAGVGEPSITDDEEADTDIEDRSNREDRMEVVGEEEVVTPVEATSSFTGPASPPTTARATRSSKKTMEALPDDGPAISTFLKGKGTRNNLFDSWQKTKPGIGDGASTRMSRKRDANGLDSEPAPKRARNGV